MQKLIANIEQLLMLHDCVIVPGLGGFVANRVGAKVSGAFVSPSSRSLLFNDLLTYNDGLLAQEYMRQDKMSFQQAMQVIKTAVEQLQDNVRQNGEVVFGRLGTFSLDLQGALLFRYNENADIDISNYGLNKLFFAPIEKTSGTASFGVKEWVAAAAVLLLLILPINMLKSPEQMSEASFVSAFEEMNEMQVEVLDTAMLASDTITVDSLVLADVPVCDSVQVSPEMEISFQEPTILYHIIIASLPSSAKADLYMQEIASYGFKNLKVVNAERRYRISVADFKSESEAEIFLYKFQQKYQDFASAWIMEMSSAEN